MLQMVAAMRSVKKRKYRVKKAPELFRVKAHWKRPWGSKSKKKTIYIKAHWRTRSCWKL